MWRRMPGGDLHRRRRHSNRSRRSDVTLLRAKAGAKSWKRQTGTQKTEYNPEPKGQSGTQITKDNPEPKRQTGTQK